MPYTAINAIDGCLRAGFLCIIEIKTFTLEAIIYRFTNRHLPGDKQVRTEVSPACHYEVSRRTVSYIPGQTDKELEEAKRENK